MPNPDKKIAAIDLHREMQKRFPSRYYSTLEECVEDLLEYVEKLETELKTLRLAGILEKGI